MGQFILSIDPSINNIGWCYLFGSAHEVILLDYGMFKNNYDNILDKMNFVFQSIQKKINELMIDGVVVEETLININPFASLKLSKGQSSAICASFNDKIPLFVYSCKTPRKAILHDGNAKKKECRIFIENILGKLPNEHIADAALLGYFHCKKFYNLLEPIIKINKIKNKKNKDLLRENTEENLIMTENTEENLIMTENTEENLIMTEKKSLKKKKNNGLTLENIHQDKDNK